MFRAHHLLYYYFSFPFTLYEGTVAYIVIVRVIFRVVIVVIPSHY